MQNEVNVVEWEDVLKFNEEQRELEKQKDWLRKADCLTASLICMDMTDIKSDIDTLLDNGIYRLHADFMDGNFVPRLGVSPELIQWIRKRYGHNVEIDSHLMVQNPYDCIDVIAPFSDWVFFHYEATPDPVRILQKIGRVSHAKKGVAYNLATPVDHTLQDMGLIDGYLLMGISPGFLGTGCWPSTVLHKIHELSKGAWELLPVFVDGGVRFSTLRDFYKTNATKMVCGSSTLFNIDEATELMDRDQMIKYNIERIKKCLVERGGWV